MIGFRIVRGTAPAKVRGLYTCCGSILHIGATLVMFGNGLRSLEADPFEAQSKPELQGGG